VVGERASERQTADQHALVPPAKSALRAEHLTLALTLEANHKLAATEIEHRPLDHGWMREHQR
jgi:hypothetical protein